MLAQKWDVDVKGKRKREKALNWISMITVIFSGISANHAQCVRHSTCNYQSLLVTISVDSAAVANSICIGFFSLRQPFRALLPSKRRHWQSYIFIDGKTFFSIPNAIFVFVFFLSWFHLLSSFDCLLLCYLKAKTSDANIYCAIVFGYVFSRLPLKLAKWLEGYIHHHRVAHVTTSNQRLKKREQNKQQQQLTYELRFEYMHCNGNDDSACLPLFNDSATLHITLILA